ncbi:MAG: hypothetical protein JW730_12040 [Anaerolineales bacterium]|nr:hypothetical protein [Anaerolineales bacterium]
MTRPIPLKIACIGGRSRGWARKLMIDLALAFQACFNDPTGPLPIDTAWEFLNRMLEVDRACRPAMKVTAPGRPYQQ